MTAHQGHTTSINRRSSVPRHSDVTINSRLSLPSSISASYIKSVELVSLENMSPLSLDIELSPNTLPPVSSRVPPIIDKPVVGFK